MKVILLLVTAAFLESCNLNGSTQKEKQPNILIILADDLGYADVGFHNSDISTPNIDKLAYSGVRLENFYACPMCTPTRAGLMTGRYPIRYGLMRSVIPPYRDFGLDPNEIMLPEMLAEAGYEHRACIGKWHLGHLRKKWHPNNQGFTYFAGCYNGAIDYFTKVREGETDWHRNSQTVHTDGYVTDIIADEAVGFINSVPDEEPYFLYVPFTAPHSPYQAKEEDIAKYPHREGKQRIYAAMVDCMDQAIGRIIDAVEKRGDRDNTFILFFSDNGGVKNVGDNSPMKGNKLTVYEGGIRVVAAANWPAGGVSGGKIIHTQMGYIDIFPTLKAITQGKTPNENELDGINVLESIKGNGKNVERKWFTYLDQNVEKRERFAVNYNNWKLVLERDARDTVSRRGALNMIFHLDSLHIESSDVNEENPKFLKELLQAVEAFSDTKSDHQISRYNVGKSGFTAPKDWMIEK